MANGVDGAAEDVEEAILRAEATMDGWDYDKEVNIDVNQDGVIDGLDTIGELLNSFGDEFANEEVGFTIQADDS